MASFYPKDPHPWRKRIQPNAKLPEGKHTCGGLLRVQTNCRLTLNIQHLARVEEFKKVETGLYLDNNICEVIARSGCWAMIVDSDTQSLTFTFQKPAYIVVGIDHNNDDEEEEVHHHHHHHDFEIAELSPLIPRIMPDAQILRLRPDDGHRGGHVDKFGLDDADIVCHPNIIWVPQLIVSLVLKIAGLTHSAPEFPPIFTQAGSRHYAPLRS